MKAKRIQSFALSFIFAFTVILGSLLPMPVDAKIKSKAATTQKAKKAITVYVTNTGSKYHSAGCRYLSKSCISIPLTEAKKSYGACSRCNPPK